jgi:PAS domain S-box-containing protein
MTGSFVPLESALRSPWSRGTVTLQALSRLLLLGAVYYAALRLSTPLISADDRLATLRFGNAVLVVTLLLNPFHRWWRYIGALMPWALLGSFQAGIPAAVALWIFAGNATMAMVGAAGAKRFGRNPLRLDGLAQTAMFVLFVVILGPIAGATVMVLAVKAAVDLLLGLDVGDFISLQLWPSLVLTNALTAVAGVPVLLAIARMKPTQVRSIDPSRIAEALMLGACTLAAALIAFVGHRAGADAPPLWLYAPLVPLPWAAMRFGTTGVAAVLLFVAIVASTGTAGGGGQIVDEVDAVNTSELASFLLAISLPLLFLAAVLEDKRREMAAVRQSQERYRTMVESSTELICRYLPDGTLTFVNEAYCRYFGRRRESLIGVNFLDLLPEDARDAAARHVASIVAEPRVEVYEHQVRRPDGSTGWQEWVDRVITGVDGSVVEIQAVGRDVTERHRAEEALRRSEERYRALAGVTSDYVYEVAVQPDGRRHVRWVTDAVTQVTGYNVAELAAMGTMAPFVYEEDREQYDAHIARLQSGHPSRYEVRFRHKDGSVRWQRIQVRPEPDPLHPGAIRWLGAAKDITEQKVAEEERTRLTAQIERDKARMDALLESVPALVWEAQTAPSGETQQIEFISEYAETLTGYRTDEWFSTPDLWLRLVHPDDREAARRRQEALVAAGGGSNRYRWLTKDGRVIWVEAHIRVTFDGTGCSVGLRGVTLDITERRQAEESLQVLASRLLQLQDEERRRIARELHDVTAQNLFAITMNLTRVRASVPSEGRSQSLIADSLALGEQALQEIRTLSYVLHPPLLDQTGLGPALQWYVDGFTSRSGIDVQLVVAGDIGRLPRESETALFRIVQESLTNIHRHSGSGTATIRLSHRNCQVVLQIRDRGSGIDQAVLSASPDEIRTLGVGIPGMRQRMRQLGGDLQIESSDRGTVVTATAPVQAQVDE